jgi:hypothetical protein
MVDQFGFPTSKLQIAQSIWMRISPLQRFEIMQAVGTENIKGINKSYRACLNHMVNHMIEFAVDGNMLSGELI